MKSKRAASSFALALSVVLLVLACQPPPDDLDPVADISLQEIERGSKIFHVQCARCHGFNGAGSSAPTLQRAMLEHAKDDESLRHIIQFGIPGTEMPGSWVLTPPDIQSLAAYVRSLGKVEQKQVAGDAVAGKLIYLGKGGCPACHMIDGDGGSLGPDLSRVGARQSADFMQRTLLEPGFFKKPEEVSNTASGFVYNLVHEVKTNTGREILGMRVNEDAFTLQLRDAENNLHSLRKSELTEVNKIYGKSLMPSVKNSLSDKEAEDLLAYLVSLK